MENKDKEISKLKKLLKTKIKELTEIQKKIKEQTNPFAINTPKKQYMYPFNSSAFFWLIILSFISVKEKRI